MKIKACGQFVCAYGLMKASPHAQSTMKTVPYIVFHNLFFLFSMNLHISSKERAVETAHLYPFCSVKLQTSTV